MLPRNQERRRKQQIAESANQHAAFFSEYQSAACVWVIVSKFVDASRSKTGELDKCQLQTTSPTFCIQRGRARPRIRQLLAFAGKSCSAPEFPGRK